MEGPAPSGRLGSSRLPMLLTLLLLTDRASAASPACPMNATEMAPIGARLEGDVLFAGQPTRSYQPGEYRKVANGFELCKCVPPTRCVRKCCKPNQAYFVQPKSPYKCSPYGQPGAFDSFAVPKLVNSTGTIGSYEANQLQLVYGILYCASKTNFKYRLEPSENKKDNFRISETGQLLNESGFVIADSEKFCIERFSDKNFTILPIVCSASPPSQNNELSAKSIMYTVVMILSLPFLLATLLVYALIRDLQNLHGKSLMCHVATLLVAYTSLIVNQFTTNSVNSEELCIALAYIMQFSFLASFFWLNVMCFDLWWTFSRFRPPRGNLKENEAKKFIYYSIYAWGCTFLILIITYCKQSWPSVLPSLAHPGIGIEKCWFSSKYATVLYFYGPVGILLFSNLLMFIYTAVMIVKHMKEAKVLNGCDSKRNVDHEKQRFMLYLKLFIVMGVNWSAEIISWAVDSKTSESLWYVTDIGNALQGVLIFLIFVCKKRVLVLLNKKLCPQVHLFKLSTNASTRTTNSTISRTASTKIKDYNQMAPTNVQSSNINQLRDIEV